MGFFRRRPLLSFFILSLISFYLLDKCLSGNHSQKKEYSKTITQRVSVSDLEIKFRNYIKNNLNDPSSFKHVETTRVNNSDGTATILVKYRAKNPFNATITKMASCKVNVKTGKVIDVHLD